MPLYTFYLCGHDAEPYTFEVFERSSDAEAQHTAGALLAQHPRASSVNIWAGERQVMACHRQTPLIRKGSPFARGQDA